MTPDDVDRELYYWIRVANESRERFFLPVGLIEESIARLKSVMGQAFLATVLQKTEQPIALLVGEEINPLRLWLGSPGIHKHILQVLEFCASLRTFANDRQLDGKIEKLKRDAFHPIFFE